jgi:hypothetical protein
MGTLIKGVFLGAIGAVVAIPALIVLALFGLPLFIAGAALLGVFVAVPFIVLAALALPMLLVAGVFAAIFVVAIAVALKLALFVVLPILLLVMGITWIVRHANSRRNDEYAHYA